MVLIFTSLTLPVRILSAVINNAQKCYARSLICAQQRHAPHKDCVARCFLTLFFENVTMLSVGVYVVFFCCTIVCAYFRWCSAHYPQTAMLHYMSSAMCIWDEESIIPKRTCEKIFRDFHRKSWNIFPHFCTDFSSLRCGTVCCSALLKSILAKKTEHTQTRNRRAVGGNVKCTFVSAMCVHTFCVV